MTSVQTEHYQSVSPQNVALQRLVASRDDLILYSHLFQASLVVERTNPLRWAVVKHRIFVRTVAVVIVIALSVIGGALAPQIAFILGLH